MLFLWVAEKGPAKAPLSAIWYVDRETAARIGCKLAVRVAAYLEIPMAAGAIGLLVFSGRVEGPMKREATIAVGSTANVLTRAELGATSRLEASFGRKRVVYSSESA